MSYSFPNLICKDPDTDDQVMRGMVDDPAAATDPRYGYIDLRTLRDDKTVHRNPNKGWFWHYIDNGTIGTWGEGHTVEGEERVYPMEVVKRHFDLHAKYFPDTIVVCNDDHIAGRMCKGIDEVQEMLEYARARGFGVQDDSICCDGYTQDCGYDTMRAPWAVDALAPAAPSVIEMAHYWYIKPQFEAHYRDGFTAIEAFKNAHATFAGFHGYPRPWLTAERSQAEYCANRLGYWYFVHAARIPQLTATAHNLFTLWVENRGWARAYHKYDLKLRLQGENGSYIIPLDCDNRAWLSGGSYQLDLRADLQGVPAGRYSFEIGLFAGARPVYLALKDDICADGWYTLKQRVTVC